MPWCVGRDVSAASIRSSAMGEASNKVRKTLASYASEISLKGLGVHAFTVDVDWTSPSLSLSPKFKLKCALFA